MVMREASALERNIERWLERHRRDAYAEGRRKGLADGLRIPGADRTIRAQTATGQWRS